MLAAGLLLVAQLALAAGPAARIARAASPPADLAGQAAALAARVAALQTSAEQATEAYDAAEGRLGAAVTARLLAQRRLAAGQRRAAAAGSDAGAGVRAVYEAGGPLALYASLLAPGGLTGLADRTVAVDHLVQASEFTSRSGAAADRRLAALDATLAAAAASRTTLATRAAAAALSVQNDLATVRRLLAAADIQVRAQAAADAAAARARDQAAFAALRAAAQARAAGAVGAAGTVGAAGAGVTPLARAAIAAITTRLGTPYQWGGTGPVSYDCSGLTGYAYAAAGVSMPRTAAQQYLTGPHVALADLAPGDLMFWGSDPSNPASIDHVAMYAGGDLMWSDDHTGDVARLQPVWMSGYVGATRVDPAVAAAVPGPRWVAAQ